MAFVPPAHTVYQWANAPSTGTPLDKSHLEAAETDLVNLINQVAEILGLGPTAVKTSAYPAAATDLVPVDTTSGSVTVTLPASPADQSLFGVMYVKGGTNNVTVACSAGQTFNTTSGPTTLTLAAVGQSALFIYNAALNLYYIYANRLPLNVANGAAQLGTDNTVGGAGGSALSSTGVQTIGDARYPLKTNNLSDLSSVSTARSNLSAAIQLSIHAVASAAVTPTAGQFIPYDISGGSITDVLPNAPADGTVVGIKLAKIQSSPIGSSSSAGALNSLTINTQGIDHFSDGVSTSSVFYAKGQAKYYQYSASPKIWYAIVAEAGTTSPWCSIGPITNVTQTTTAQYCINAYGEVRIRANLTPTTTVTSGTTLFTLPSGLRPSQTYQWECMNSGQGLQITTGGVASLSANWSSGAVLLDGLTFVTT